MEIIQTRHSLREMIENFHRQGKSIGFVPTMGALHQAHLSLVDRARQENDVVVVSIFVNPAQFGKNEDFHRYPRNFEHDKALLEGKCTVLFCPDGEEMYGSDEKISFSIRDLTSSLCGMSRCGHFEGVCLVLAKFFQIVRPNKLYLGQKDYQQTVVIRHLVHEFFYPIEVVVVPTVREADGLAMSSRNVFLSDIERTQAPFLFQSLQLASQFLRSGERNPKVIIQKVEDFLLRKGIRNIDYVDVRDAFTLGKVLIIQNTVVVALAVFFDHARLIDNILFSPHETSK